MGQLKHLNLSQLLTVYLLVFDCCIFVEFDFVHQHIVDLLMKKSWFLASIIFCKSSICLFVFFGVYCVLQQIALLYIYLALLISFYLFVCMKNPSRVRFGSPFFSLHFGRAVKAPFLYPVKANVWSPISGRLKKFEEDVLEDFSLFLFLYFYQ